MPERTFTSAELNSEHLDRAIELILSVTYNPAFILHLGRITEQIREQRNNDRLIRDTLRRNYGRSGQYTDADIEALISGKLASQRYTLPGFRLTEAIINAAGLSGEQVGALKLETYAP